MRNLTIVPFPALAIIVLCLLGSMSTEPASAQTANEKVNCAAPASKAEPATAPDRQSADGTAPGNSGSTGWTGGTGGAYIGTNPQGATGGSTTWQPPTARGLDLAMAPETSAPADC